MQKQIVDFLSKVAYNLNRNILLLSADTEIADMPDHMIHLNANRFLELRK